MSIFDEGNYDESRVAFGPINTPGFSHDKYYRALGKLLTSGLVVQISPGGHGRKAIFDLLDWGDRRCLEEEVWE